MKKLLYVLIAFITLNACKKEENPKNPHPIVETTWELVSVNTKPVGESDESFIESYNITNATRREYILFSKDNTTAKYYKDNEESNTLYYSNKTNFTIDGNTIASDVFSWVDTFTYSIDGETLTIIATNGSYYDVYVYRKSTVKLDLNNAIESVLD